MCDNKEDTLVIIRTEFGRTIGGYTHYPWDSKNEELYCSSRRAFLFSLDMKEKFVPLEDGCLIYRDRECGPTFGGECGDNVDLALSDCCNISLSHAEFPSIYNRAGRNKLKSN